VTGPVETFDVRGQTEQARALVRLIGADAFEDAGAVVQRRSSRFSEWERWACVIPLARFASQACRAVSSCQFNFDITYVFNILAIVELMSEYP
jgi:hypothetical protein